MAPVGVGVVGCGFMGERVHLPSLRSIPDAEIIAVSDVDEERARRAAGRFRAKAYASYSDLIKDPGVEAVIVSVPTFLHAEITIEAARVGKHVLCELPLAITLEDVDRVIETTRRAGVLLLPGSALRYTPNYAKAKELIEAGRIGKPVMAFFQELVPAQDLAAQWPPGSWAWQKDKAGGPLMTMSIFSVDLLRWLLSSGVARVRRAEKIFPLERFGGTLGYNACALLAFESGAMAAMAFSGSVNPSTGRSRLEVVGDSGNGLCALGNNSLTLYGEDPWRHEWEFREQGPRVWGHQQQDQHFIECITQGKKPLVTPEDARKAHEVAMVIAGLAPER